MATNKPRVNLTLEPDHYEILTRLAKVQGTSRARIINELFKEVVPQLESVVVTLEQAKAAAEKLTPEAKARLRAKMQDKEAEALEAAQELKQAVDDGLQMGLDLIGQEIEAELKSGNDNA
jgi:hypothetical protein